MAADEEGIAIGRSNGITFFFPLLESFRREESGTCHGGVCSELCVGARENRSPTAPFSLLHYNSLVVSEIGFLYDVVSAPCARCCGVYDFLYIDMRESRCLVRHNERDINLDC
jgi:hypothetical protein